MVVVQFLHPFCPHRQAIKPVYDELAVVEYEDKLKFIKLNVVDNIENEKLAGKYGVMVTPTFFFFCGGRPVKGIVRALSKEDMAQAIELAIKKYKDCTRKSTPLNLSYIN